MERKDSLKITKENIYLDENIIKKLKNTCTFASKKGKIHLGSIRYIPKTNIAYIEPTSLIVDGKRYLIFGSKHINYISETTIYNELTFKELEEKIKY